MKRIPCFNRAMTLVVALFTAPLLAAEPADSGSEIEQLRKEIVQMKLDYETRIADLERRLDAAEESQARPVAEAPPARAAEEYAYDPEPLDVSPTMTSSGRDNSFNPAIGVTLQGQAWSYGDGPDEYYIPGFPLGGEAGPPLEGLSLAESEITMSANVDDKFMAMLTVPIVIEDGETVVELEEAWVETLALPAGLALRMGRFFADVGYLNTKHFHSWDFADQPLVYQAFLGNQYIDDGLQLRWLAPADFYLEFSGEILRGDRYPAGGAARSGVGSGTLSVKTGGDIGFSNSWLFGLSWIGAEADERESGSEDDPLLFTGDTDIYIADFVWKWAPMGNSRQQNFKFQAEYMWRKEDGFYNLPEDLELPWDEQQQGWYAQAIYQPFPRWRFGVRYDRLSGASTDLVYFGTPLYSPGSDPERFSAMVDWSNSEFSRLRLQYELDHSGAEDDHLFGLQYIFSIGAHGAHSF